MEGSQRKTSTLFSVEEVSIGERSSRLSSAIFILLWAIPIMATVIFGAVDTMTWVILSFVWAVLIILWIADSWRGKGILLNTSVLQFPLLALLVLGLVQLAPFGGAAVSQDAFATRIFCVHLSVYLVFFAACLTFINRENRLKSITLMVVIFGTVMAFLGILQRLANPEAIYGLRQSAQAIPFGPFINQHHFAAFMEMTGGVALGLLFGKRTRRDRLILLATAVVIMGMAVVFTSSRGGMLGFLATLAFVGLLNFLSGRWSASEKSRERGSIGTQRKIVTVAAAAALVLVIFGSVLLLGGNEELFRGVGISQIQDGVSNGRAHFWPIALKIFAEHPILGAGFDAFGVAFTKHDTWNGLLRVEQAHNDYLQTLADAGLAGFACVAAFIYLLFRKSLAVISKARGFRRNAAVGALAGCFGIMIHSFFDFPLRTPSNAFFFLLLCAIATVSIRSRDEKRRRATSP